jgi:RES domain
MSHRHDWRASLASAQIRVLSVRGSGWRSHASSRDALDHNGYLFSSGRFHRGVREFGEKNSWPGLYTSSSKEIALAEFVRQVADLEELANFVLSELSIKLTAVLDCRDPAALGLEEQEVLHDSDFSVAQELAGFAHEEGYEGMVIRSATALFGENVIIFPRILHRQSSIEVIGHEGLRLRRTAERI